MKTFYLSFLLIFNIISLSAQDELKVVASASMLEDMAVNLSGGLFNIECIVPIGGDPHLHTPTPRDAKLVASADLVFVNGLTFEGWINELIENSGTKAEVVTVTNGIQPITNKKYNSHDPHAWMDASNALVYARNITDAYIRLKPEEKELFEIEFEKYTTVLKETDQYIENEIKRIPEDKRILITSHDAFAYYGKRYGIQLEAIMGISTEAEAQTSDIIRVSKVIRENEVPAVFIESTINPKLLEQIAKDNKVRIGGKLYADSLGDEESPASTYVDMLKHNTKVIVDALTSDPSVDASITESESNIRSKLLLYLLIGGLFLLAFVIMILKLK